MAKLVDEVKEYIASTVEGYLNGCYDDNYEPMTREEWKEYVMESLRLDAEKNVIVNDLEPQHLYFYGKDKIEKLVEEYLDTYEDVQPYIKK